MRSCRRRRRREVRVELEAYLPNMERQNSASQYPRPKLMAISRSESRQSRFSKMGRTSPAHQDTATRSRRCRSPQDTECFSLEGKVLPELHEAEVRHQRLPAPYTTKLDNCFQDALRRENLSAGTMNETSSLHSSPNVSSQSLQDVYTSLARLERARALLWARSWNNIGRRIT